MKKDFQNKLELLKRKNQGKLYFNEYKVEIENLILEKFSTNNLISLAETLSLPKKTGPSKKVKLAFEQKYILEAIFVELINLYDDNCIINTWYSNYCGAYKIESLNSFNINFKFEDEHQGLIQIKSFKHNNELILDFYVENESQFIEVEISGDEWFGIEMLTINSALNNAGLK